MDATRIVMRRQRREGRGRRTGVDIYNLIKYQRSNQNTNIHQRPIVKKGDKLEGRCDADGAPPTWANRHRPEHAGRLHALERLQLRRLDLISERVVAEDRYTSIHIEELVVMAARHQAGRRRNHARHPEPVRAGSTAWTSPASSTWVPKCNLATRWWARSRPKGETTLTPEENSARHLRREGFRREGHLAARGPGLARHVVIDAGVHP